MGNVKEQSRKICDLHVHLELGVPRARETDKNLRQANVELQPVRSNNMTYKLMAIRMDHLCVDCLLQLDFNGAAFPPIEADVDLPTHRVRLLDLHLILPISLNQTNQSSPHFICNFTVHSDIAFPLFNYSSKDS